MAQVETKGGTDIMMTRLEVFAARAGLLLSLAACSGSGGSGTVNGAGFVTTSCTTASLCTQIYVPPSAVSQENSTCTGAEQGTPGTGCSTKGLIGCCTDTSSASREEQCYYTRQEASLEEGQCKQMGKTWSSTL